MADEDSVMEFPDELKESQNCEQNWILNNRETNEDKNTTLFMNTSP